MLRRFGMLLLIALLTLSAVILAHQTLPDLVAPAMAKPIVTPIDPEVAKATREGLLGNQRKVKTQPQIRRTIVEGKYAIATWQWGEAGGQSVLMRQGKRWKVLTSGGGAVDLATLKQQGIPKQAAEQLMQKELAAQAHREKEGV